MGKTRTEHQHPARELTEALQRLLREVVDGLTHGFFDLGVKCELVKNRKRQLTIKAGKSYRFTICEEELRSPLRSIGDSCDWSAADTRGNMADRHRCDSEAEARNQSEERPSGGTHGPGDIDGGTETAAAS